MKNVTYKFCYVLTLLRINFVIINFEIINFVTEPSSTGEYLENAPFASYRM
jgi:hypothetical protein